MKKYEKIETIYRRDTDGSKNLLEGVYCNPTVEFLSPLDWIWTEKIDGTNIRVMWDGHSISFGGRTDKDQIPKFLMDKLNEIFMNDAIEELFEQMFGEKKVIIFGEGYGKKIQKKGLNYISDGVDFIVFDILIGDNYQPRENVMKIACSFGLKVVPIVGIGSLTSAVEFIKTHPTSTIAEDTTLEMEGVVCRPRFELRDRNKERIIVKIKWKDIKELV